MRHDAAQRPQSSDAFDRAGNRVFDLFRGGEPPQAEAHAAADRVLGKAQGAEHVAWLGLGGSAGAAGAYGNVAHLHNEGLALDGAETGVQVAGQPEVRQIESGAVERHIAQARAQAGEEPVAQYP